jgi:uncharacterized protein YecE (DUF72 family)
LIGTSGWMYRHWAGFYPEGLPSRRHLEFFARAFPTVEINASFYMLPKPESFARWRSQTPPSFVFAVKASRYLTHLKRLIDPEPAVEKLLTAALPLGDRLGPVLLQLPPAFAANPERLDAALAAFRTVGTALGLVPRVALEPRHASWFASDEILAILRAHDAALVLAHSERWPTPDPDTLTASWVYARFHGAGHGLYGVSRLRPWARRLRRWHAEGRPVFAYFNNDWHQYALRDARTLIRLADGEPAWQPTPGLFAATPPPGRGR